MKLVPGKSVKITILSLPAHLSIVRAAIEKMCQMVGFEENCIGRIILSVDEAMSKIGLVLTGLAGRVRSVFEITKLDHVFDIKPSDEEALA